MTAVRPILLAIALVLASAPTVLAGPAVDFPTLVDIRAAHHPGFDRLVFEFTGGLPTSTSVAWVDRVTQDGSGRAVPVQGEAFLLVSLHGVLGHELTAPMEPTYGPRARAFALPNVAHVVNAGDFEAVVSFGVGLMQRTRILRTERLRGPARFVVDVAAAFPTVPAAIAFVEVGAADPASLSPSDALALTSRSVPIADQATRCPAAPVGGADRGRAGRGPALRVVAHEGLPRPADLRSWGCSTDARGRLPRRRSGHHRGRPGHGHPQAVPGGRLGQDLRPLRADPAARRSERLDSRLPGRGELTPAARQVR